MAEQPYPGWYPDPEQEGMLRYWSGKKWLTQTKPADPNEPWQPPVKPKTFTDRMSEKEPQDFIYRIPYSRLALWFIILGAVVAAAGLLLLAPLGGGGNWVKTQAEVVEVAPSGKAAGRDECVATFEYKTSDGQEVTARPEYGSSKIYCDMKVGDKITVEYFEGNPSQLRMEPPSKLYGVAVTLIGFAACATGAWFMRKDSRKKTQTS